MRTNVEKKQKAIELRKQGCGYSEIMDHVDVAKSTLSGWLSGIDLTEDQLERLEEKMQRGRDKGRYKALITHREKRKAREKEARKQAKETFETHIRKPLFAIGLALYWAEGAKKNDRVSFMNSDPDMVKIIMDWYQEFLGVDREDMHLRLYIHKPYEDENCEKYWADELDVSLSQFKKTVFKPTPHSVKKNQDYKGCLRLSISGIQKLRKVLAWQKLFIKYYSDS